MADEPFWRMGIFSTVLAVLFVVELVMPFRHDPHRLERRFSNLLIFIVGAALVRVVLPLGAVGFATLVEHRGWGMFNLLSWPAWFEALIAVVLLDFAIWAQHVGFHKVPWLWRLHRMHHADTHLDFSTGLRFHPVEIILSLGIKLVVIAALGPSAFAVFLFEVLLNSGAMITHANWKLPGNLERMIRFVFVTPGMHRVHHSAERIDTDSNYGFNLALWDRLFQTYRDDPVPGDNAIVFGLAEFRDPREQRIDRLLTQPFRDSPDARQP